MANRTIFPYGRRHTSVAHDKRPTSVPFVFVSSTDASSNRYGYKIISDGRLECRWPPFKENHVEGQIAISSADLSNLIQTPVRRAELLDRCDKLYMTRSHQHVDFDERPDPAEKEKIGSRLVELANMLGLRT